MFEESEWRDAADPLPADPPSASPRRSPRPRRHLLATLRRLQSLSRSTTEDEADPEQRPRKRIRGGPDPTGRTKPRSDAPSPAGTFPAGGRAPPGAEQPLKQEREPPEETPRQTLTRKQWRNRKKNKRRRKNKFRPEESPSPPPSSEEPLGGPVSPTLSPPAEKSAADRAESLRLRMEERLEGAHFRCLNELLYSCSSQEAARLSREDPEAFAVYHRGFARQVSRWPQSPVQSVIRYLRNRPSSLVVADFGCGDCTLARSVRNKVHCFDLVALDPRVTVCDMAQVPLEAESVDVAVFCLSLMGTNLREILEEANRVLRMGGTLLVVEISSRFQDVRAFLGALARPEMGFRIQNKDLSGSHFYSFELRKASSVPAEGVRRSPLPGLCLRRCLYKRR